MDRVLTDGDMLAVIAILKNNYTDLWDLLHYRNWHTFSSGYRYYELRNEIFGKLERYVHSGIKDYWHADIDRQEYVVLDILSGSQDYRLPHRRHEWECYRHRHNLLLGYWGLNYSFVSTEHQSEELGVPQALLRMIDRVADAQKMADAELQDFRGPVQHGQFQQPPSQHQDSTSALVFSPTQQATHGVQGTNTEMYFSAAHNCQLRRPVASCRIQKYLYIAQSGIRKGYPGVFRQNIRRAINHNNHSVRDQWLKDYAELPNALDWLNRIEEKLEFQKSELDPKYDCLFCIHVAQANVAMLRERLLPVSDDERADRRNMYRQIFHHYHNYTELDSSGGPRAQDKSFEDRIRWVATQLDMIVDPAKYRQEHGGPHRQPLPPPSSGPRFLCNITRARHTSSSIRSPPSDRQDPNVPQPPSQTQAQELNHLISQSYLGMAKRAVDILGSPLIPGRRFNSHFRL